MRVNITKQHTDGLRCQVHLCLTCFADLSSPAPVCVIIFVQCTAVITH